MDGNERDNDTRVGLGPQGGPRALLLCPQVSLPDGASFPTPPGLHFACAPSGKADFLGMRPGQLLRALHSERPSLGLMLCCDILNRFKQGALHFHFVLGSAAYVARPACVENGVSKLREEPCLEIIYGTLGLLPITGSEGLLALGKDQFW